MSEIKPELVEMFLSEANGYLNRVDAFLKEYADRPMAEGDVALISDTIHNFKGVAGMVGCDPMAKACEMFHTMFKQAATSTVLTGEDFANRSASIRAVLDEMLVLIEEHQWDELEELWEHIKADRSASSPSFELPSNFNTELLRMFLEESKELIPEMTAALERLIEHPESGIERGNLFRYLMNLKGSAGMIELVDIIRLIDALITILDQIDEGKLNFNQDAVVLFRLGISSISEALLELSKGNSHHSEQVRGFFLEADTRLPELFRRRRPPPESKPVMDDPTLEISNLSQQDIQSHLQKVFHTEGEEHLANLSALIMKAEKNPDNPDLIHQLFRVVHTLKGAAATVGFHLLADSAHQLENFLDQYKQANLGPDETVLGLLYEAGKGFRLLLDASLHDEEEAAAIRAELVTSIERAMKESIGQIGLHQQTEQESEPSQEKQTEPMPSPEPGKDSLSSSTTIRVSMRRLDLLMNLMSELRIHRSRMDELVGTFAGVSKKFKWERKNLNKVIREFQRKHQWDLPLSNTSGPSMGGFSDLEFDRYNELAIFARNMEELDFKISSVFKLLEEMLGRFTEEGSSFNQLVSSIQDEMVKVRMVPVSTLFHVLEFQTYNLARMLGKKVKVKTYGGDTELDKAIVTTLADSLVHIIRNCLDHGIEPPGERETQKKDSAGTIRFSAMAEKQHVVLRIDDDGRGIDTKRILEEARKQYLMPEDELDRLTHDEILNLIFHPNISTRSSVDSISGRGVGMDAVRHAISESYGSIQVESELGIGTRYVVKLPMTLALQSIISVMADTDVLCLSMSYVEEIYDTDRAEIVTNDLGDWMIHEDQPIPLRHLKSFFHTGQEVESLEKPVVVLKNGDQRMALMVDAVMGRDDVIVRPLSPILDSCIHFLGSTITPQGEVRLVLNIPFIFEQSLDLPESTERASEQQQQIKVLIADDSLSVRQTIKLMLERHGFKANTAKDGLAAWQKLHGIRPHVMIVDLEMPNLNGFELMERVRNSLEFSQLPIVVLTSRGGAKHRQRALSMGADTFLSKPVLEKKLVLAIRNILPNALQDIMDNQDPMISY